MIGDEELRSQYVKIIFKVSKLKPFMVAFLFSYCYRLKNNWGKVNLFYKIYLFGTRLMLAKNMKMVVEHSRTKFALGSERNVNVTDLVGGATLFDVLKLEV